MKALSRANYVRKSLRLGRSFLSGNYIHCNLQVTYRCNFQCAICDFWKPDYQHLEELTLGDIRTVADKLAELGTFLVSLAGGEPLIRNDLDRVIGILAEDHFPILITNGWFVDEDLARALFRWGLQEISVSVDYASAAKHDAMRGRPGAFDRGIKALELLRKNRPAALNRVHMITVLMDDNIGEIEDLIRIAQDLKVTYLVTLYSFNRGKKAERLPKREVSDFLLGLKEKHANFVSLSGYIKRFDEAIARGGIGDCLAGKRYLNVDNRGNVARCTETTDEPVGNILTEGMLSLRDRLHRQNETVPCAQCWTSCRGFAESMYKGNRLRNTLEFFNTIRPY
jgi:radical SAM protein with 4Fe4S-binding SPASM domain